jgi:hypothetical protein
VQAAGERGGAALLGVGLSGASAEASAAELDQGDVGGPRGVGGRLQSADHAAEALALVPGRRGGAGEEGDDLGDWPAGRGGSEVGGLDAGPAGREGGGQRLGDGGLGRFGQEECTAARGRLVRDGVRKVGVVEQGMDGHGRFLSAG